MTVQLDSAVVLLRDHQGRVSGAGVLAGDRLVVTCAHVVTRALNLPEGIPPPSDAHVLLDFPLVAKDQIVTARVTIWHPTTVDGEGDIAGLELTDDPPGVVQAARLLIADELWRHNFRTFGFPAGHDEGVWASGRLLARQAMQWVQMEDVKQTGFRVEPGFSGAPVWDDELDGVVGITVAAERRPEVRAAYLIPAGVLVKAWPALAIRAIPPCPYRGLSAFREQDEPLFFGREELTDQLVEAVVGSSLVAVIGPSGSGKSSLVFAGLVPRLRQRLEWVIADLRPARGSPPMEALAAALLPLLEPGMTEAARLQEIPTLAAVLRGGRLAKVVDRVLDKANAHRLLLVVDQFEELFALESVERQHFIDVLLEAVTVQEQPAGSALAVVLTLRADFLGQALTHTGLVAALQGASRMLGPMTREQLRQAIEAPAAHQVTYEPGLVDRILDDVGENPGNLPLLEFALTLLWERQANGKLTHTALAALGGVDGALARYAEEVYLRLPEPDREDAHRLFVQLVRPGEETQHLRRVARRADLGDRGWQLAQRLASTRLVVTGRDLAGAETVEVVHEALLSSWYRLREWTAADLAFRAWQERTRSAIAQWEASGRDDGALLRGAPLAEAERWLQQRPTDIGSSEPTYIARSRTLQDHQLHLARRQNRRLRGLAASLGVLTIVAVIFGVLANQLARRAALESREATSHELAAEAEITLDSQPELSILLSVEAYRTKATAAARSSLLRQVQQRRGVRGFLLGHRGPVMSVAFSPDGRTLASASADRTIMLWDVARRTHLETLKGVGELRDVAFSRDGRTLASAGNDGTVRLWDLERDGGSKPMTLAGHTGPVASVAFSRDGRTLASAGNDGTVGLWDLERGTRIGPLLTSHSNNVNSVAFSRDGHTLASGGDDGAVIVWDLADLGALKGHTDSVNGVAFSPDGRTLASASTDRTIMLWDVARRTHIGILHRRGQTTPDDATTGVAFSPLGHILASSATNGTVTFWDVDRQAELHTMKDRDWVMSVAFSPDGRTLASGVLDGTVTLWDVEHKAARSSLKGPAMGVTSIAFSSIGHMLASGAIDGTVALWDVNRSVLVRTFPGAKDGTSVAFSPDGHTLAWAGDDKTVLLWDLHRQARIGVLIGHTSPVTSLAFSPDGHTLASGGNDGTVILWDLDGPARVGTLTGHVSSVTSVAFSPDRHTLASAGDDQRVVLWEVDTSAWSQPLCRIVNRDLTKAEWDEYLPKRPYRATCS